MPAATYPTIPVDPALSPSERRAAVARFSDEYRKRIAATAADLPWHLHVRPAALLADCAANPPADDMIRVGSGCGEGERPGFDRTDPRVRELRFLHDLHLEVLAGTEAFGRDLRFGVDTAIGAALARKAVAA